MSPSERAIHVGKGHRRQFEQMLAWAKEGRIRGIAVWDCDRLSRNPDRDNARIIELADKNRVELATVCGEYDLSTSAGRMMFRIAGALARRESEHRAERLMPDLAALADVADTEEEIRAQWKGWSVEKKGG